MAYNIYKADGTAVTVPDNIIDSQFYDPSANGAGKGIGTQLIGRNAIDYGTPVAQNFLQLTENFCGSNFPSDTTALQGQLWFKKLNSTSGELYVRVAAGTGLGAGLLNWKKVLVDGDSGSLPATPTFTSVTADDFYGGTFHGVATSAQYADLAERYEADAEYEPGTVVSMGGAKEITSSKEFATDEMFGVISTRPGMQLNSAAGNDITHPYVAQVGRIPVKVSGKVKKGQRLVASDIEGVAIAITSAQLKTVSLLSIIGRALQDKSTDNIGNVLTAVGAR